MKDTCTPDNSRDFRARYINTVGALVKEGGEKQWVWIKEVNDTKVSFSDLLGKDYEAINGKGVEFEFTQVPMGWYNTSKGPMLFMRKPARQWQRGIASGNTRIYNSDMNPLHISLENVADAMSFKGVRKDWPWALSKFFCVNKDKELLFLDDTIGTLKDETFTVGNTCSVVQELQDTLRRLGMPHIVVMEKG